LTLYLTDLFVMCSRQVKVNGAV